MDEMFGISSPLPEWSKVMLQNCIKRVEMRAAAASEQSDH